MEERRKTGRPWKGPRKRKSLIVPIPLAEAAEQYAKSHGMDFNDFCARLMAEHLREQGIDISYTHPIQEQLMTA
ncbi:hypothetical protein [Amycolatopsis australiensis]|uniref:Uncharacterized protein n=1 Tax=Amycolatopsis australiensis TaxID=546364 RepID=A0A1K1LL63_9PSEU|nr:hypothetical protein [Amycolatopsis australiensis]SFW11628.1 hypothetical protein SAMN04489730_0041 [Amycolatopsis australiensis]